MTRCSYWSLLHCAHPFLDPLVLALTSEAQDTAESLLPFQLEDTSAHCQAVQQTECSVLYCEVHTHCSLDMWEQVQCSGQLTSWEDT